MCMRLSGNSWYCLLLFFIFILPAFSVKSQRIADVKGKYTYILTENDNVTIKEAKIKSIELAKAEAIKEEFGVLVASDFITSDKTVNDELSSVYLSDTSSSVKGEWLGDERTPEVTIECVNGELLFTAEVWGKAREIVRANTDIKWQVCKDLAGNKIEADQFDSGNRFFVKFKSPIDGYVAVYLITSDNETACLLPYRKNTAGRFQVKGGKEYVFFDKSIDPDASFYKLSTNKPQEYNQLVVIYSPNAFTKCTDVSNNPRRPNTLDERDFAKWLLKSQRADNDMVVSRKWVMINGAEDN